MSGADSPPYARVVPIVEGHGEQGSVRILLQRIWTNLLGGDYLEVLQPIRIPRTKLVRSAPLEPSQRTASEGEKPERVDRVELERCITLARLKLLRSTPAEQGRGDTGATRCDFVLVLLDADEDPACELGPAVQAAAEAIWPDLDAACVLANPEYETWFVAAAESLDRYLEVEEEDELPEAPEEAGLKKGWVQERFQGARYSETVDQPRMTAAMDLELCRRRSPSFDKLCRELEARLTPSNPPPARTPP